MTTGRVIKNYNGFYYVDTGKQELVECRRRGKLKAKILVGDQLSLTDDVLIAQMDLASLHL